MQDHELIQLAAEKLTSAAADGRTISSPTSAAMALFSAGLLRAPLDVDVTRAEMREVASRRRLDEHRVMDLLETAWGIIANANPHEGGWDNQPAEWVKAAEGWRDGYHDVLDQWIGPRPPTFRKKPVEVQAMRWKGTAESATPIINWILEGDGTARYVDHPATLHSSHCRCDGRAIIPAPEGWMDSPRPCPETEPTGGRPATLDIDTLEGTMSAMAGDWIIRGTEGEFYPCKPAAFDATFEPVDNPPETTPEQPFSWGSTAIIPSDGHRNTGRMVRDD